MDLSEKEDLLTQLHEDVGLCADYLLSVHTEVIQQDISNYPIFVASRTPVELGRKLIDRKELDIQWSFYASHLEEFAVKEIVSQDKVEDFIKVYKEHPNDFCFFVVLDKEFNFVFSSKRAIS